MKNPIYFQDLMPISFIPYRVKTGFVNLSSDDKSGWQRTSVGAPSNKSLLPGK
jgi:hypothetical protein